MQPRVYYSIGRWTSSSIPDRLPTSVLGIGRALVGALLSPPIDPHTVLGGFPTDNTFRSIAEDATSFVVTYPVDSSPANRSVFSGSHVIVPKAVVLRCIQILCNRCDLCMLFSRQPAQMRECTDAGVSCHGHPSDFLLAFVVSMAQWLWDKYVLSRLYRAHACALHTGFGRAEQPRISIQKEPQGCQCCCITRPKHYCQPSNKAMKATYSSCVAHNPPAETSQPTWSMQQHCLCCADNIVPCCSSVCSHIKAVLYSRSCLQGCSNCMGSGFPASCTDSTHRHGI